MASSSDKDNQQLSEYEKAISEFAEKALERYLRVFENPKTITSKEINDPVCGTIHLTACEIVLIDSPLFQRLRRIKQLGVVHLVYVGASNTRFDHSLGVLHRAGLLVKATNNAIIAAKAGSPIGSELEQLIRLTGLCHDLGHGLMSHVSENALEGDPVVSRLQGEFSNEFKVEKPSLSEMAAFYMIRSTAFKKLLDVAWRYSDLPKPQNDIAEVISFGIIGVKIDADRPLLHEIVTGPYDADKLDYLTRDAHFTGVPNVIDINRLVQKIRVGAVGWQNLPPEIAKNVEKRQYPYVITGVAQSGARTLDELALARALQHDKIYRHHKVRACEAMVASILSLLDEGMGSTALLPLRFNDDPFLDLNTQKLYELSNGQLDKVKAATAEDLITRLGDRNLFVRAFAWEHSPRAVGLSSVEDQTKALLDLKLRLSNRKAKGEIAKKIAESTLRMIEISNSQNILDGLIKKRLKNYIWINGPAVPNGRSLLGRALLITRDGAIRRFRDDYPDTEGWSDQYLVNRDVGYVFAPREIAPVVYLASELVFRSEFGLRMNDANRSITEGIDTVAVNELRLKLAEAKFYVGKPRDLLPTSPVLSTALMAQDIAKFLETMREFSGPAEESGDLTGLTESAVIDFLRQFDDDDKITQASKLLANMRFFGRSELVAALKSFLEQNPEFSSAYLCPLGSAKDSSAVITYYASAVAANVGLNVVLPHELPSKAKHIIFLDDFIGSGRQVIDILEAWFGKKRSYDLGEDRSLAELSAKVVSTITNAKLGLIFCAGLQEGHNNLQTWLKKQKMDAKVLIRNTENSLPTMDRLIGSREVTDEFKKTCQKIGSELLKGKSYTPNVVADRSLGYGNKGLLIAFPYNVPAQTLTLLWDNGTVEGLEWLPLLKRHRKR